MNILETILKNGLDENILGAISAKTGIDTSSIQDIVSQVAPKLVDGAKQNLASTNDSGNLINMISNTDLDSLKNNPDAIDNSDNSNMLGELFSSLDTNESDVANELSAKSGVDATSISSLLPMLAPLVMGALNQKTNLGATDTSNTNDITSMLTNFIDQDNDGSVVDDLMGMAKKFF
ncbi:DUF937 domain-containing protein [Poseidonibacter ostreae]|jgi:hypothetical protein|uniref:DUF937 domain-containing protein n=2 Tax=Poseidonibacter ostreae TaxID=2654171 RepID=A0A6L4WRA3_9BACT|nr:DUF937 domain-containing protein [Poseidonibacter ostreae]KAB7887566.1 DUF937 domain-containing protein [Poseidonibacter ostreae]MAC83709.1 hypothetical protein [Arcobacter sp.]|tara:strand:- start:5031 stop:5561 length:531 start_codon:yes stop_codon:yes gene_type:complete